MGQYDAGGELLRAIVVGETIVFENVPQGLVQIPLPAVYHAQYGIREERLAERCGLEHRVRPHRSVVLRLGISESRLHGDLAAFDIGELEAGHPGPLHDHRYAVEEHERGIVPGILPLCIQSRIAGAAGGRHKKQSRYDR